MEIFRKIINLIRAHPYIQTHHKLKQFIKFAIVGACCAVIDFGIYLILTRFANFNYLIANLISFSLAATANFIFNKFWTFRDYAKKRLHVQYIKFIIIAVCGLFLNELILYLLTDKLDLHDILSKTAATVIILSWNFTMQRAWTFKNAGELLE
ncbi:GtrA family protein [Patescibacteria group bacterium]|nr:GtrA family protein [Patescibacteria group bacterium]MBU4512437.1 GtrA family protein [Patescibacteria group bacterium]MCG2691766.1 GtrA family protein [Microgenomates group bacterium]MCG2692565.1 GtrA family protein [Candidatus Parcubacteria bacterium]